MTWSFAELRAFTAGQRGLRSLADLRKAGHAGLLDHEAVRLDVVGLGQLCDRLLERDVFVRRFPVPARLAGLGGQLVDRRDRGLHLLMTEKYRTQHDVFGQAFRLGLDHQHGVLRACDHQVEIGIGLQLSRSRIKEVLAVLVARPAPRRSAK